MIDWMFICILMLAIIIFFMIILLDDEIPLVWIFGLMIFDIAIWYLLASGNLEIEIPYQIYNATTGNIETSYQIFSSKTSPALTYVFSAPAVLMIIYMNYFIYTLIRDFYKNIKERRGW